MDRLSPDSDYAYDPENIPSAQGDHGDECEDAEPLGPCRGCDAPSVDTHQGWPWCQTCLDDLAEQDRDPAYDRAAARARSNDFEDTDGRDWT